MQALWQEKVVMQQRSFTLAHTCTGTRIKHAYVHRVNNLLIVRCCAYVTHVSYIDHTVYHMYPQGYTNVRDERHQVNHSSMSDKICIIVSGHVL